jgi:hypothetical protein
MLCLFIEVEQSGGCRGVEKEPYFGMAEKADTDISHHRGDLEYYSSRALFHWHCLSKSHSGKSVGYCQRGEASRGPGSLEFPFHGHHCHEQ